MAKRTIINLIPGQELELHSTRGIRVSYPGGKPKIGDPKAVLTRDTGTWVEPAPEPTPEPEPEPTPEPTPPPPTTTLVSSVVGLLGALADDSVTDITVKNGRYPVTPAAGQGAAALWIGSRFAGRTKPVTVHAETKGGVIFDGGGALSWGGISFEDGAHDQVWDGFTWENGSPADGSGSGTGIIVFGGYAGKPAAHHITLRNCTVKPKTNATNRGHAVYFSWAVGGVHDIVLDGFTVDEPAHSVMAALHFYHSDSTNKNAWNVTVRNSKITGTQQAVMLWDSTLKNVVIEDTQINAASEYGVRYEYPATGIVLRRVTTTNSGVKGFYSPLGSAPAGLTIEACSFG